MYQGGARWCGWFGPSRLVALLVGVHGMRGSVSEQPLHIPDGYKTRFVYSPGKISCPPLTTPSIVKHAAQVRLM